MTVRPPQHDLVERVTARQEGVCPQDSAWLLGRAGLRELATAWAEELTEPRQGIGPRVEELQGPGGRLARIRRLSQVLATLALEGLVIVLLEAPRSLIGRRPLAPAAAHRLRRAFEHLGPFFIKLGQFISSGRGLFPDVLVDEFAACRDACPTLSSRVVRRAVEAELGPIEDRFASFDPVPLSAASIAQVHAATLRDGTRVVVKVQRPGLRARVETAIRTTPVLARLAERLIPHGHLANPHGLSRLFAISLLEELDFRLEAQNMVDIALDLESSEVRDVVVPRPIPGLVTERVLVMERLDGHRFDDLAQMQAAGIDTGALLLAGVRSLVEGATVFGRFHGDLHAGNVICLPDGRFGLIDFGICSRLTADERAGLQKLLVGIATRDSRSQVHGLDWLGAVPPDADRRALIARFAAMRTSESSLSIERLQSGAPELMRVFVDYQLQMARPLYLFFKDVLYLNGSIRLLAPHLDLMSLFVGLHSHFDGKYGSERVVLEGDEYGPPIGEDELDAARRAVDGEQEEEAAPAPTLGSVLGRFGPRLAVDAIVPVALFLTLNTARGLVWAIGAVSIWSAGVAVARRRGGRSIGPLLPIVLGFLALRGTLGIVTGSHVVYFGPGIVNNFLFAGLLAGSVAIRRPIIGIVAPFFYPFTDAARHHPAYRRIFGRITLAWAAFLALQGAVQVWLLATASTNTFVVGRAVVGWPAMLVLFAWSLRYPRSAFQKVPELAETAAAATAAARARRR